MPRLHFLLNRAILLAFTAFISTASLAQTSPYQAIVPVADSSESSLQRGLTEAIQRVLEGLGGNDAVYSEPGVALISNPRRALQAYSFDQQIIDDSGDPTLVLNARFTPEIIDKAINGSGFSLNALTPARLIVGGIRTRDDYARALTQLRKMSAIQNPGVVETAGDQVMFELEIRGGQSALDSLISQSSTFQRQGDTGTGITVYALY